MKKLFVSCLWIILLTGCSSPWTRGDSIRQGAYLAVTAIDWHQTREIATERTAYVGRNGAAMTDRQVYREGNPILGEHPRRGQVDRYFVGAAVVHTAIAAMLPTEWRKAWQYITIGGEGAIVLINFEHGLGR